MPKIRYKTFNFQKATRTIIIKADEIVREYQAQGFSLTLRQLYYQFVARDIIPNSMASYDRLGSIINNARLAGLIDWDAIEDRTRNLSRPAWWHDPADILESCHTNYRENLWKDQDTYVEAWIEKDALMGVLDRACATYRLPRFSCRGYVSQSEMWGTAQRLMTKQRQGKQVVILHLGDHDPSGIDMSRDILDRLIMFMGGHGHDRPDIRRLALNMDQVRKYRPPPNPAKVTDSRFASYVELYGRESWELDALEPKAIQALIEGECRKLVDSDKWAEALKREKASRKVLARLIDHVREDDSTDDSEE